MNKLIVNKELNLKTHFNALNTMLHKPPATRRQKSLGGTYESIFEEVMRSPPKHFDNSNQQTVELSHGKKIEMCWYDSLIEHKNREMPGKASIERLIGHL